MGFFAGATQVVNPGLDGLISSRHTYGWKLIDEQVLTGPTEPVTINNIPGTFRHLCIISSALTTDGTQTNDDLLIRINNDVGNNYNFGDYYVPIGGALVSAGTLGTNFGRLGWITGGAALANTYGYVNTYIPYYTLTDRYKVAHSQFSTHGTGLATTQIWVGQSSVLWLSTSAITRLDFLAGGAGLLGTGSRFSLYGIL